MRSPCRRLADELESCRETRLRADGGLVLSREAEAHLGACLPCQRLEAAEAALVVGLRAARLPTPLTDAEARRLQSGIRSRLASTGPQRGGHLSTWRIACTGLAAALVLTALLLADRSGPERPTLLTDRQTPAQAAGVQPVRVVWSDGRVDVVVRDAARARSAIGSPSPGSPAADGAGPLLASSCGTEWPF